MNFALAIALAFLLWIFLRNLKKSIHAYQRKSLEITRENQMLMHKLYLTMEEVEKKRTLPLAISGIPMADRDGLIVNVKKMNLPHIKAPYNGSLVQNDGGYFLSFRFDVPSDSLEIPFFSKIGLVKLDAQFEVVEKESLLDTKSSFSEDARIFHDGSSHYLLYNDLFKKNRTLHLAKLDEQKKSLEWVTPLAFSRKQVEKNWTPFITDGKLHFLYSIETGHVINADLKTVILPNKLAFEWSKKWGSLRGGTPAVKIGDVYLSFFHSSFEDSYGIIWYVMGAYTFLANAPFSIQKMSPHPIMFDGIYSTFHQESIKPYIRSIYPVGLVVEKDLIHVSCGENDSAIKIITFNKEELLRSLC